MTSAPTIDRRTVTVERLVRAPASILFVILRDPATHLEIDGSGMLRGEPDGPSQLGPGDRFTMSMSQLGMAYRSQSTVVEYAPDRLIAWETIGFLRGRKVVGGQWWRYELVPDSDGTLVRHSYIWGRASLPLLTIWLPGYPRRMRRSMPRSLDRLAELAESRPAHEDPDECG